MSLSLSLCVDTFSVRHARAPVAPANCSLFLAGTFKREERAQRPSGVGAPASALHGRVRGSCSDYVNQ